MSWIWAALMPHPPIIIPEVGRGRERPAAEATIKGAEALSRKITALPSEGRPDFLLILSPHQPYVPGGLFFNIADEAYGSLARFNAPGVSFSLTTAEIINDLTAHLKAADIPVVGGEVKDITSDHGSMVPLYFLYQCFNHLPPVVLANPAGLTPPQAYELGQLLSRFSHNGLKGALLASGDLSHRLTPNAPAGYSPEGPLFDQELVETLRTGQAVNFMRNWPGSRLSQAGECGARSALVLMGLANEPVEVVSYEGPFGVGYCNALWLHA